jgi:hypothetical protein
MCNEDNLHCDSVHIYLKVHLSKKKKQKIYELILNSILATMFCTTYWQPSYVIDCVIKYIYVFFVELSRKKKSYKEVYHDFVCPEDWQCYCMVNTIHTKIIDSIVVKYYELYDSLLFLYFMIMFIALPFKQIQCHVNQWNTYSRVSHILASLKNIAYCSKFVVQTCVKLCKF